MVSLNASLVFKEIMSALQQECHAEVEHYNIQECGSEMIVDDMVLFKLLLAIILQYFEVAL